MSSVGPTPPNSGKESRAAKNAITAPAIGTMTATRMIAAMIPPIALPPLPTAVATSVAPAPPAPGP